MKNLFNHQPINTQPTYMRVVCTVCGVTESMYNIYNQQPYKLLNGCYHCDPILTKKCDDLKSELKGRK